MNIKKLSYLAFLAVLTTVVNKFFGVNLLPALIIFTIGWMGGIGWDLLFTNLYSGNKSEPEKSQDDILDSELVDP